MKKIFAYLILLLLLLSNGMIGNVIHHCNNPLPHSESSCCGEKNKKPKSCCKKKTIQKSIGTVCCSKVNLYYFTPKYFESVDQIKLSNSFYVYKINDSDNFDRDFYNPKFESKIEVNPHPPPKTKLLEHNPSFLCVFRN